MKKPSMYFIITCFCTLILVLPGCGSSSANSPQTSVANNPKTVQKSPDQSFYESLTKAYSSTYSVAIKIDGQDDIWLKNCDSEGTTYTQKGNNYRVDHSIIMPVSQPSRVTIYNDTRKQVASLGIPINRNVTNIDDRATSGWLPATGSASSGQPDFSKHPAVIEQGLGIVLRHNQFEEIRSSSASSRSGSGLSNVFLATFNITMNNDTFVLQDKTNYEHVLGDTRYIIERKGPEALPSKISKQVDDYGANKGGITLMMEFEYTNFNNISDNMFELPSDVHQDGKIESDWLDFSVFCAKY